MALGSGLGVAHDLATATQSAFLFSTGPGDAAGGADALAGWRVGAAGGAAPPELLAAAVEALAGWGSFGQAAPD